MYTATIYCCVGNRFSFAGSTRAFTMTQLKRNASRIANTRDSAFDKMVVSVHQENGNKIDLTYYRINKKAPNNTNVRGKWE